MTDALPGFTFDPKTGELRRDDRKAVHLPALYRDMLACVRNEMGEPVNAQQMINYCRIGLSVQGMCNEVRQLNRRIAPLGLVVNAPRGGRGFVITVKPMPKWQPNIPPPVTLESAR